MSRKLRKEVKKLRKEMEKDRKNSQRLIVHRCEDCGEEFNSLTDLDLHIEKYCNPEDDGRKSYENNPQGFFEKWMVAKREKERRNRK